MHALKLSLVLMLVAGAAYAGRGYGKTHKPEEWDEVVKDSLKEGKPVAVVFARPETQCPFKEQWNEEVRRRLSRHILMVRVKGFEDVRKLPEKTQKAIGNRLQGSTIMIFNADLDKIVFKVGYERDEDKLEDHVRAAKDKVDELEEILEERRWARDDD